MDYLISLLLVLPCARAGYPSGSSPFGLGGLIDLRSQAYPVYASDSSGEEYEAFAVATLPQHQPVRIVQIFSPPAHGQAPLARPRRPARRPRPRPDADVLATHNERRYEPAEYEEIYASSEESRPKYSYSKYRDQFEDEDTVVMYARPNRHGGYTYRRAQAARVTTPLATPAPSPAVMLMPAPSPTAVLMPSPSPSPTPPPTPAPTPRQSEPVIIRIHKYRVIH